MELTVMMRIKKSRSERSKNKGGEIKSFLPRLYEEKESGLTGVARIKLFFITVYRLIKES